MAVAAFAALWAASTARADLQWNRPTHGQSQRAETSRVQLAAHEMPAGGAGQQLGVRTAAQFAATQFDPFESTASDTVGEETAAKPSDPFENDVFGEFSLPDDNAIEPAEPEIVPEADDAADAFAEHDGPLAEPIDGEPRFDPFDETPAPAPSSPAEDLEAAEDAIEAELQNRDNEQQMQSELPAGDADVDAELAPGVERELPGFDAEGYDSNLDDLPYDWRDEHAAPEALTPEQEKRRMEQLAREREQAAQDCEELRSIARRRKLADISLDISLQGDAGQDYPFECSLGSQQFAGRSWPGVTYRWKAAGLCHKPLYFEQVQLERYGHSWGPYLQPLVSGAHFFATIPILPYKMGIRTPNECVYTLGYYRPGSCAPYMIDAVPFTWRAAAFQGAAATGTAFVIP